jgi:hypothetical protein
MIVRRRIWTEGEMIPLRRIAEIVKHDAGLDACPLTSGIELQDPMHVLGQIHDHGHVAALTGEASAAAPRQQGRAIVTSRGNSGDDIVHIARDDDPDRNLPVIRAVGRVKCAAAIVESHFAAQMPAQLGR